MTSSLDEKKDLEPLILAEKKFKFIEKNYPQSKIHLNHSTDTSYYRNQISKFKNIFKGSSKLHIYEDFGIQIDKFNRDRWSFDWNRQMRKRRCDQPKANLSSKPIDLMNFDDFSIPEISF